MNPSPIERGSLQQGDDEARQSRRRLLKAAVSAAPLVATLPSGAAYALASTSQCITSGRQASQQQAGETFYAIDGNPPTTPDGFNRVPGYRSTYYKVAAPTVEVTVYSIGSAPTLYFGSSGTLADTGTSYTIGSTFNPASTDGVAWSLLTPPGTVPVSLLKLYRAGSDTLQPASNPTCATDCLPNGTDLGSQCVFPVSQLGAYDATGANPGINMGLANSCLLSVYVGVTGRSCPLPL